MTAVAFVLAAAIGASVRYAVNLLGRGWYGTLVVNVVGAFVLGWLVASDVPSATLTVVGTGFCGTLTTFSSFALEATGGPPAVRIKVITSTLVLGIAAAAVGLALA